MSVLMLFTCELRSHYVNFKADLLIYTPLTSSKSENCRNTMQSKLIKSTWIQRGVLFLVNCGVGVGGRTSAGEGNDEFIHVSGSIYGGSKPSRKVI